MCVCCQLQSRKQQREHRRLSMAPVTPGAAPGSPSTGAERVRRLSQAAGRSISRRLSMNSPAAGGASTPRRSDAAGLRRTQSSPATSKNKVGNMVGCAFEIGGWLWLSCGIEFFCCDSVEVRVATRPTPHQCLRLLAYARRRLHRLCGPAPRRTSPHCAFQGPPLPPVLTAPRTLYRLRAHLAASCDLLAMLLQVRAPADPVCSRGVV